MYQVSRIVLFSTDRWPLDVLTFLIHGFGYIHQIKAVGTEEGGKSYPPRFWEIRSPYSNQAGGRLCPPHYSPPPSFDFQTFLRSTMHIIEMGNKRFTIHFLLFSPIELILHFIRISLLKASKVGLIISRK